MRRDRLGDRRTVRVGALLATALLLGCGPGVRNDPETRAAALLTLELSVEGRAAVRSGDGRVWLRLMPEATGEAVEAAADFTIPAPKSLTYGPRPDGLPRGTLVFEELLPGRYRLSSFTATARVEQEGVGVRPMAVTAPLPGLGVLEVRAGELLELGTLKLTLSPDRAFAFESRAPKGLERAKEAAAKREDLGLLRPREASLTGP